VNAEGTDIEASGITKRFGAFVAVDHVDLAVRQGELFGLLGPNGAGKTTLVRMLTGLVRISDGSARVAGVDVATQPDRVRQVLGVVPQALTSDLDLTGYENMDIHARFFGVRRAERKARIEELLTRTGLWDRRKDLVRTYSGGMRRRLEIARGLIHKPRVLFLDEPTIGLDPQSRLVIWDLLRELRNGTLLTISLTTHYLDEAEALCDRVAIVDGGRIVALGSPQELKARVPGSDTIEVGLGGTAPQDALGRLQKLEGVRSVRSENGMLSLHVDGGDRLLPRVLELLGAAQVPVRSANLTRLSLEDVFIHFTGRSLRTEGVNAGAPKAPMVRQ
jgi:ABC-2 type transport system ATP-binding protein